ncbi:MAG: radical SAM/SPASM domain-containing protein [Rhodospirillales bacterium]|jgi:hypothetical protein
MSERPLCWNETEISRPLNPFWPLYARCNAGDSKRKWLELPSFPRIVDLELTNSCNFRCLMCPTGAGALKRARGMMAEETFIRFLKGIRGRRVGLRFIGWGEPMIHPRFLDFLSAAKQDGHLVHVNTNGSYLTSALADRLLDIGIDSIKFSVQGVTAESYRSLHQADFFEPLLETAALLYRRRADGTAPFIQISAISQGEPPALVEAFKRRVAALCDFVNVGSINGELLDVPALDADAADAGALERLAPQDGADRQYPQCPEVFDKLSVFWDGRVTACCADSGGAMQVGDLQAQTVREIWRSPSLERYRRLLSGMNHDRLPLCRNCRDTHRLFASAGETSQVGSAA